MAIQDRKEREFKRREQEILGAALTLFNRDDWQTITVEQISQEAEIGKGTVYKHFESKDEIYARLALNFHRQILAKLQQLDPAQDVISRLRTITRIFWEEHLKSREHHRLAMYCMRDDFRRNISEATRQEFEALDAAFAELIHGILQQGIDEGIFPRKPLPLLLFGAQAAIKGAIMMAWSGCLKGTDPNQYLEEITNFILAGLVYQDRRFS